MQRWVIAGLVVMLAGVFAFLWSGGEESPSAAVAVPAPVREAAAAPVAAVAVVAAVPAVVEKKAEVFFPEPPPIVGKLDPKSDLFIEMVDEILPRRIYGQVADRCYQQNFPDWQKIKLSFKERTVNGRFLVTDVQVISSNIEDEKMKNCIVAAVRDASFTANEMPDWEDEDEIFIRVSGMKKYLDLPDDEEE